MWMTGKAGKKEDHQILNKAAMFIFLYQLEIFCIFIYIYT